MKQYRGNFPPKTNPTSEFRRLSFKEGLTKERFYQLSQYINEEKAYIYSIDDTSHKVDGIAFIREFTISLINEEGLVYAWYQLENPVHLLKQKYHESFTII